MYRGTILITWIVRKYRHHNWVTKTYLKGARVILCVSRSTFFHIAEIVFDLSYRYIKLARTM